MSEATRIGVLLIKILRDKVTVVIFRGGESWSLSDHCIPKFTCE